MKPHVLFITTDTTLLDPGSPQLVPFLHIGAAVGDMHVVVVRTGLAARYPVLPIGEQLFIYTVGTPYERQRWSAVRDLVQRELIFKGNFRPDLIVSDASLSAMQIAGRLSREFCRPWQLQVGRVLPPTHSFWERWRTISCASACQSFRATTPAALAAWERVLPDDIPGALLPQYRPYLESTTGERSTMLHTRYPQYKFFVVYHGLLDTITAPFLAIDAVRMLLRNPTVALVLNGTGSAVADCERRITLLGLTRQVIFDRSMNNPFPYLESADIVLVTDVTEAGDEVCLMAAATGAPIIATNSVTRADYFQDNSAVLTSAAEAAVADQLQKLLGNAPERRRLGNAARVVALATLPKSHDNYEELYRQSIMAALSTGPASYTQ